MNRFIQIEVVTWAAVDKICSIERDGFDVKLHMVNGEILRVEPKYQGAVIELTKGFMSTEDCLRAEWVEHLEYSERGLKAESERILADMRLAGGINA